MSKPWDKIRVQPEPPPIESYPIGSGVFEVGMGIVVDLKGINSVDQRRHAPGAYLNIGQEAIYWYPSEMRTVAAFLVELADQIENKNGTSK